DLQLQPAAVGFDGDGPDVSFGEIEREQAPRPGALRFARDAPKTGWLARGQCDVEGPEVNADAEAQRLHIGLLARPTAEKALQPLFWREGRKVTLLGNGEEACGNVGPDGPHLFHVNAQLTVPGE